MEEETFITVKQEFKTFIEKFESHHNDSQNLLIELEPELETVQINKNIKESGINLKDLESKLLDILSISNNKPSLTLIKLNTQDYLKKISQCVEYEKNTIEEIKSFKTESSEKKSKIQMIMKFSQEFAEDFIKSKAETQKLLDETTEFFSRKIDNSGKMNILAEEIRYNEEHHFDEIDKERKTTHNQMEEDKMIKNELFREVEQLNKKLEEIEAENNKLEEFISVEEENEKTKLKRVESSENKIEENNKTIKELELKKNDIQSNIESLKEELEKNNFIYHSDENKFKANVKNIQELHEKIKRVTKNREKMKEHLYNIQNEVNLKIKEINHTNTLTSNYKDQNEKLKSDLNELDDEIANLKNDKKMSIKRKKTIEKMIKEIKNELDNLEVNKETLFTETNELRETLNQKLNELNQKNNDYEFEKSRKEELERLLIQRKDNLYKFKYNLLNIERNIKRVKNQYSGTKKEINRLNNLIKQVKIQQEKYNGVASVAHAKFYQAIESLKVKNYLIAELQNRNKDLVKKLKQQKALYETVRNDREVYSKSLIDLKEEINEFNKSFMALSHQIKNLKEEISFKSAEILKLTKAYEAVNHESEVANEDKAKVEVKIKEVEENIHFYQTEINNLKILISEANIEKRKKINIQENITAERDLLGLQYFKRKKEMEVLKEKLQGLENELKLDQNYLMGIESNLGSITQKLNQYKDDHKNLVAKLSCYLPIKLEIINTQKELLNSKIRVSALENKLNIPVNIHRWRTVEATQPEVYAKIMKIQKLQKKLIEKSNTVMRMQVEIEDKEKLLKELRVKAGRNVQVTDESEIEEVKLKIKEKSAGIRQMLHMLCTSF